MADVQYRIFQATSENNDLQFHFFKAALNEAIQRCSSNTAYVRENQAPSIDKTIIKKIMKR